MHFTQIGMEDFHIGSYMAAYGSNNIKTEYFEHYVIVVDKTCSHSFYLNGWTKFSELAR